jgi:uncharacterized PurR-regulated membrane protein YhhQ (DUF165 family)
VYGPDAARSFIFAGLAIAVIGTAAMYAARRAGGNNAVKPTESIS